MTRTLGRPAVLFGSLAVIVALTPVAYIVFELPGLVFALVATQLLVAALGLKAIHISARTKKQITGLSEKQQHTKQIFAEQYAEIGQAQEILTEGHQAVITHLKEIRKHQDEVLVLHKQSRETQDSVVALTGEIESQRELLAALHNDVAALSPQMTTLYKQMTSLSNKTAKNADRRAVDLMFNVNDLFALYHELESDSGIPKLDMWAASPDLLRFLWGQVLHVERRNILECGSGVSTVLLAQAFKQVGSGKVTALEHNEAYFEHTKELVRKRGLEDWADVIYAPLVDTAVGNGSWQWYEQTKIPAGPIDLLIVDGPPHATGPKSRYPALPILSERLAPRAMVVLDDYRRPDEQEIGEMWKTEFPDFIESKVSHSRGTLVLIKQ